MRTHTHSVYRVCVHARGIHTNTRKRRSLAGKHAVSLSVADAAEIERDVDVGVAFPNRDAGDDAVLCGVGEFIISALWSETAHFACVICGLFAVLFGILLILLMCALDDFESSV